MKLTKWTNKNSKVTFTIVHRGEIFDVVLTVNRTGKQEETHVSISWLNTNITKNFKSSTAQTESVVRFCVVKIKELMVERLTSDCDGFFKAWEKP